ncbi:MAG: TolC family protein, partial [Bacteroidales bacterium]|nr:TolC family protein [Bacteroidales bacterium]
MKRLIIPVLAFSILLSIKPVTAQDLRVLTLDQVIRLAEEQSPLALMAKHRFRASYWQYRTYVAQYRP